MSVAVCPRLPLFSCLWFGHFYCYPYRTRRILLILIFFCVFIIIFCVTVVVNVVNVVSVVVVVLAVVMLCPLCLHSSVICRRCGYLLWIIQIICRLYYCCDCCLCAVRWLCVTPFCLKSFLLLFIDLSLSSRFSFWLLMFTAYIWMHTHMYATQHLFTFQPTL